jgi:filamentous hemagglutinin
MSEHSFDRHPSLRFLSRLDLLAMGGKQVYDAVQAATSALAGMPACTRTTASTSSRPGTATSSASIGASVGAGGLLVNASASGSKGKSDGTETSYSNSHVTAGNRVMLTSGGDTTIRGGVIEANTVIADIGGNLNIESLQDTSRSDSKQQSAGGGLSVGIGVWSASASVGNAKAKGDYASVTEQSGIKAGDGGFQIGVKGNTDLKGGVISSTQAAIDGSLNSLKTGTLTTSDIENHSDASAESSGFGISSDMFTQGKYGVAKGVIGNVLDNGSASGSARGTTRSAVSEGSVVITDEAGQLAATGKSATETVAALNRDTANAHNPVRQQDMEAMQKEAQAQQTIKNAAFKQVTVYTDDAYRTMFKEDVKFYRVTCGATQQECMNDASLVKMEEIDADTAKREGKVLAVNGIFNTEERAGQLAYQNASVDNDKNKPSEITLMHIAPAETTVGELMVATYEQKLASTLGYTNADNTYADTLQGRGQEATISMGHSRGTIVQTNAFNIAADNGYSNELLKIEGVGMAVSVPTYTTAGTRVVGTDEASQNITATYMTNDPVSVIAAGNPGDAMAAILEFYNVVKSSNSAHSCYGTGATGCATIASPVPGGPQPTNQQPGNVVTYQGGQLVPQGVK